MSTSILALIEAPSPAPLHARHALLSAFVECAAGLLSCLVPYMTEGLEGVGEAEQQAAKRVGPGPCAPLNSALAARKVCKCKV